MQNKEKKGLKQNIDIRTLTVSTLYYRPICCTTEYVPFIRLCGKWLRQAGFEPGEKVGVIVVNKTLVITKNTEKLE